MKQTFSYEEVEHGEHDGVAGEHVVAASAHALDRHAGSSPDQAGLLQFTLEISSRLDATTNRKQFSNFANTLRLPQRHGIS